MTVTPCVGRQDELATIDDFLSRTQGGPSAIVLEGEAGIGKSCLWKRGVEAGTERGVRVLAARPGGSEVKLAFAGLSDLLAGVVTPLIPRLAPPQRRALEIALLLREATGTPPDDRAVAAAFLACMRELAREGPLLIAIDDTQWLDLASARVLEFACRRLADEPVGLLATFRQGADERRPDQLIGAFGADRVERLELGPLTVAAVFELVRSQLGLSLSRSALLRIHEASSGNPFYVLELARAQQRNTAGGRPDEPIHVPENLRSLVRRRLELLPRPAAETLLFVAAMAKPTVSAIELAVGSGRRAERDLEAAARADVIEVMGDDIRFAHPLLASIHASSASPGTRRRAHLRLAEVVVDAEEHARHLALGAAEPDEQVAATLTRAAEHARTRGALVAAAELTEQALRLTPAQNAEERHDRVLAAAEQQYAAGNTAHAIELLEEALTDSQRGPRRAELLWSLGEITFEGQDTRIGSNYGAQALEEAGDDAALRARILASTISPPSAAMEAVQLAEQLGDRRSLARALCRVASRKSDRDWTLDAATFERAVALEEEVGGLEIDYGPTARYARALTDVGEYARARPLFERLCDRGRARGDAAVHQPLVLLAWVEFEVGNWSRAEELAREAYDVAVQTGREAAEPKGMFTLALIEAARGQCDVARAHAEQALVLTDGRGWNSGGPRGVLGFLDLSLERYEAAYEVLLPAIERYRSLGVPVIEQTFDAVVALAALGRVEEGRQLLSRCDEVPTMMRTPVMAAAASRARGLLAAAGGEMVAAEEALQSAVAIGRRCERPLELGRSLLALGTLQRRARKKQTARLTLDSAREIFDDLGAAVWSELARRELARIGGRSTPRAELSATETEIVELVVLGRSNKEVAHALHLSAKTVEWNLSKIYSRLGVHSRTELAALRNRTD